MGFLSKLFGFKWSLYIVRNDNELVYVMHENSVWELLDYAIVGGFGEGLSPVKPWSLFINFNKENKNIKLLPEHFQDEKPTPALIQMIESIDPKWKVNPGKAVFMEAATKKVLKISNRDTSKPINIEREIEKIKKGIKDPPDFFGVINKVFGK